MSRCVGRGVQGIYIYIYMYSFMVLLSYAAPGFLLCWMGPGRHGPKNKRFHLNVRLREVFQDIRLRGIVFFSCYLKVILIHLCAG